MDPRRQQPLPSRRMGHNVWLPLLVVTMSSSLLSTSCATTVPTIDLHNLNVPPPYDPIAGDMEDVEFRVAVEPGKIECFHQDVKAEHTFEVHYRVIEATSRLDGLKPGSEENLAIGFHLTGPSGQVVFTHEHEREGEHSEVSKQGGVYKICIDNRASVLSTKVVSLEIYVYSETGEDRWADAESFTMPPELQFLDIADNLKFSLNRIRDHLIKVSHAQESRRGIERRDRHIAEQNFDYVNRFSMATIAVIAAAGLLQIYAIRSLFEDKSALRRLLNGMITR